MGRRSILAVSAAPSVLPQPFGWPIVRNPRLWCSAPVSGLTGVLRPKCRRRHEIADNPV
jgi:hypothetical protein